jgi:hypothetical protein
LPDELVNIRYMVDDTVAFSTTHFGIEPFQPAAA